MIVKSGSTQWYCKKCNAERANAWYYLNHEKAKKAQRDYNVRNRKQTKSNYLKRNYGINMSVFEKMLEEQNHSCFICKTHQDKLKKTLAVDHNHKTGKIRALLCGNCNKALGQTFEDIKILKALIAYIENFNE